jgi:UbiD family decarboxylase
MPFRDFQSYLQALERSGELHRTRVEIDPVLELTAVSVRALKEGKPALMVERPKGSRYPLVLNHYSSHRRIELALGRHPDQIGEELIGFLERAFPPTLRLLLEKRSTVRRFLNGRPRISRRRALSQEIAETADLSSLPVQKCWPKDGGRFITYGQVITADPITGRRNIGIYRMHVFDNTSTGMHWQIQKGGGFHYYHAEQLGRPFEVAVAIGTSPALLLATVAPLPEGFDEAVFAGFLLERRVVFVPGKSVSLAVPAESEFVLEGEVPLGTRRMEGPFGDHFGHYSAAAEFPVFAVRCVTRRKNPVYPAVVVGKPPMEDRFLGDATQQMLGRLVRLIHREIQNLWAYYEAGFHNLLVVAIEQRYQKEAMKAALGLMGTDQLSLTKCIITVSAGVDVRDFHSVMRELSCNFDPSLDFVMIPKVPLDTLDFTSARMNLGSKMIIDATRKLAPPRRPAPPEVGDLRSADRRILETALVDDALLLVKVSSGGRQVVELLVRDPRIRGNVPLVAAVSEDVDIRDRESYIWGVFTRFDCERDVIFSEQKLIGIAPVYRGTMGIDATWKAGYPEPLVMDEDVTRRVDEQWGRIWT